MKQYESTNQQPRRSGRRPAFKKKVAPPGTDTGAKLPNRRPDNQPCADDRSAPPQRIHRAACRGRPPALLRLGEKQGRRKGIVQAELLEALRKAGVAGEHAFLPISGSPPMIDLRTVTSPVREGMGTPTEHTTSCLVPTEDGPRSERCRRHTGTYGPRACRKLRTVSYVRVGAKFLPVANRSDLGFQILNKCPPYALQQV